VDAPGTLGRREYNRSTALFSVALLLLVTAVLVLLSMPRTVDGAPRNHSLFQFGLWAISPASGILWLLSFQAIRRRPPLAVAALLAGYVWGWGLFISLAVNLDRAWP
jgi:hypothetical protein